MLYPLVQSARRNCVDVWPYLTDVLRRVAAIASGEAAGRASVTASAARSSSAVRAVAVHR